MTNTTATPAARAAARAPFASLPRRNMPHRRLVNGEPTVEPVADSEPPAMRVGLFGAFGTGKSMIIETADWEAVAARHGTGWVLNGQVKAAGARTGGNAQHHGPRPNVTLARILMDAQPGERIEYRNGDQLDVRRANLVRVQRDEAAAVRQAFKDAAG